MVARRRATRFGRVSGKPPAGKAKSDTKTLDHTGAI
jgi:hypothetical protein